MLMNWGEESFFMYFCLEINFSFGLQIVYDHQTNQPTKRIRCDDDLLAFKIQI